MWVEEVSGYPACCLWLFRTLELILRMKIYSRVRRWWKLGRRTLLIQVPGKSLQQMELGNINLPDADLHKANLRRANLCFSNLGRADLTGADLESALLGRVFLADADMMGANLAGADLAGATLAGADLSEACLRGANLKGAILRDACLAGADLRGACFENVRLTHVELADAHYDDSTRWPAGFDPEGRGARRGAPQGGGLEDGKAERTVVSADGSLRKTPRYQERSTA